MLRTALAAAVGAFIGTLAIATVRERVQDQLWHPVKATSPGIVMASAFCIFLSEMVPCALRWGIKKIHLAEVSAKIFYRKFAPKISDLNWRSQSRF